MTPHYTELKNFAEEFKTRRIRLGFTQGAVGQSLADKGYNNFAQSTISRFEQMQLSPTNATANQASAGKMAPGYGKPYECTVYHTPF